MFSTWGRLLRRDGLIRFAGYQPPQGWLSRTLTAQIQLPDIGDIGRDWPQSGWALIVSTAGQPRESFVLENLCNGDGTEGVSFVG